MRRAALAALAALGLAGCNPSAPADPPPPRFTVGDIAFTAASGAAVATAYGWRLFLTDQPDACEAVAFVPNGLHVILELRVAPQAGGAGNAAVVSPPVATPAAGQAAGGISQANARVPLHAYDAADGTATWTARPDGSVLLDAIDVGFAGVAGRVTAQGLALRACSL